MLRVTLAALVVVVGTSCAGDARDFAITPRALPTASPIDDRLPTRTPRPEPTATRTPLPSVLWVANAGREGVILRDAPSTGARVIGLTDGVRLIPLGEEEQLGGRRWIRVRDPDGNLGWIAGELVTATPPATPGVRTPTALARPSPTRS